MPRGTGTGTSKSLASVNFEIDEDGHLIITPAIIRLALERAFATYLAGNRASRWDGVEDVKSVMGVLDTFFFAISKGPHSSQTFVYPSDFINDGPWTAEQVNYIGVGMGFNYFHLFGHNFLVAQTMVAGWNLVEYGHLATFGEHYWAELGFRYPQIFDDS